MHPIFRNLLALVAGLLVGSMLNRGIVMLGAVLIPSPEGTAVTDAASIRQYMALLTPRHFIMPWLAHALGTLVGAWITASLAVKHTVQLALFLGVLFLIGGMTNLVLISSPAWFTIVDLAFAYLPMAYLGYRWRMSIMQ